MTENNYNKLIDAICELVNLAYDATTSKEEFERLDNAGADIIDCLEEIQQYRAIGTIEEFKALKEKDKPKKPIRKPNADMTHEEVTCPSCGRYVSDYTNEVYCKCRQKLDWQ